MSTLPFTKADIESYFDERDLQRGRTYWRQGAVQDISIEEDGYYLTGRVWGTRPKPYKVTVSIKPGILLKSGKTGRLTIGTRCTCPVNSGCKHAVAVCLEALAIQQQAETVVAPPPKPTLDTLAALIANNKVDDIIAALPPHIRATIKRPPTAQQLNDPWERWLDDLTQAQTTRTPVEERKERVLYIVDIPEHRGQRSVRFRAVIARILKSGDYGALRDASPNQLTSMARYNTPDDHAIGTMLQGAVPYYYYEAFESPPGEADVFDLIMRRAVATGRCYLHNTNGAPLVTGAPKQVKLGWHVEMDGTQVPSFVIPGDTDALYVLPAASPWYVDLETWHAGPLECAAPAALVQKFLAGPKILPDAAPEVIEKMLARGLPDHIIAPRAIKKEQRAAVPPTPCLRLTTFTTDYNNAPNWDAIDRIHHLALLHFDYDGMAVDPAAATDMLHWQQDDTLITMPRDRSAEAVALQQLMAATGFTPTTVRIPDAPASRLTYTFPHGIDSRAQWLDFLHQTVPALRDKGWRIEVADDFAEKFTAIEIDAGDDSWQADMREQEGGAWWFTLDLGIKVEGQRVALLPLLVQAIKRLREPTPAAIESLAKSGKLYVDLPDGRALALPFARVKDILTTLVELYDRPLNADGSMAVSLDLATALSRIDAATQMRWLGGKRLKTLIDRLKTFSGLTAIPSPRGLQATLRPYQAEGLNWLQFLRDYGLGGILADDMGLGKTVQALAHIMVEKEARRLDRPCLVVCPTSLIPNWQDEAEKFAPKLKVLALHGKDRATRFKDIAKADLVLTTYPLLPRDHETLLPLEWHMVVLDEAQAIKNPTAQVTQLSCAFKARHRICLTGTPIENHLGEAWSHFAFLMPGMLGTHKDFTKRFRIPIEKHKDKERQALLARRLKPFILRRNKSDVAKELPPKTEIIRHVEFDGPQRDLYETLRLTMHEKVQQAVAEKGFNRSRIVILDALLKLRQVCCDPRLVKLPGAKNVKHSAKLDHLMEMLVTLIDEGRRILLFSQFTSMLDLIKPELAKASIDFVEIRGSTTDRKTPVSRFQKGDVPLFLISLKAGGTGLNLTAADTVIHYDPWWNPAVENQATDRAHRIGQDKSVFVYKFIAKGTVEDRILDLQNRKRGLAAAFLEERPDATAAFESSDIEFLFQESA